MTETVWLSPPHGEGDPQEVEATPEVLVPLMIAGWSQSPPQQEETHVDDTTPGTADLLRQAEAD
jgi:hypothetical protein